MRLADTRRLDARGGWRGGSPGRSETLDLRLVSEDGQWRIDNPVNALVVPTSFFDRSFARFNLYFYDQTGRVLLPDPVFIPRGEQTATNLVRGLLAGPGSILDEISRSALPSRTDLDLSVVVTESGVAEVPLSREVLRASPGELSRAVDQLAWTLRQVPGIERVRITVGGAPVPAAGWPDRRAGHQRHRVRRRPARPTPSSGDCAVAGSSTCARPPGHGDDGPLGRPGYSMRSFAVSESPRRIAAVSGDGTTVFVAPAEGGDASTPVARPVVGGTDLLRPSYDMFGDLWLVDRTSRGARVLVVSGGEVRAIRVPGVTGADVAAFSVARDGSRLAVAYAGSRAPSVRVIDILRTDEGIVSGAGQSRAFAAGGRDATRLVDIGWRDPATLAVLSRTSAETSQVSYISSDGSPVAPDLIEPSIFRGAAQAMVVAPDAGPAAAADHARPAALHPRAATATGRAPTPRSRRPPTSADRPQARPGSPVVHSSRQHAFPDASCSGIVRACSTPGSTWSTAAAAWVAASRAGLCAVTARRPCPPRDARPGRRRVPTGWPRASPRGSTTTSCARWCSPTRSTRVFALASPLGACSRRSGRAGDRCQRDRPRAGAVPTGRSCALGGTTRCCGSLVLPRDDCASRVGRVEVRRLLEVRGAVRDQAGLDSGQRAANLHGSMGVRARARSRTGAQRRRRCRSSSATTC